VSLKNLSDQKQNSSDLCLFATTGKTSDLTNGAGFLTSVTGVSCIFNGSYLCGDVTLATIAVSGKSSDLVNTPVTFFTPSSIIEGVSGNGKVQYNNTIGTAKAIAGSSIKFSGDDSRNVTESCGTVDINGFCNHTEGFGYADGRWNHAEGSGYTGTEANPGCSNHAEGFCTCVAHCANHVEGFCTCIGYNVAADGYGAHAEGFCTCACANYGAHAEGFCTCAIGRGAHAEGAAIGYGTAAVYRYPTAASAGSHAEGVGTCAAGIGSHAEGVASPNTDLANPVISGGCACGVGSHVEGVGSCAMGDASHAEGCCTRADGVASHSEGFCTCASGIGAHAEGTFRCVTGTCSTAIVFNNAAGDGSHAEGMGTCATGFASHAEGIAVSNGDLANPVLYPVCAGGCGSHAEGGGTCALSTADHAEGYRTCVCGCMSHAEGFCNVIYDSQVNGYRPCASHVEGFCNIVIHCVSHAEGCCNIVGSQISHAEGICNRISGFCDSEGVANHIEGCCNYIGFCNCATHVEGFCNAAGSCGRFNHIEGFCGKIADTIGFCGVHIEGMGGLGFCNAVHVEGMCFCSNTSVFAELSCTLVATSGTVSGFCMARYAPVVTLSPFCNPTHYGAMIGCVMCGASNPPTTVVQCFVVDSVGTLCIVCNCGTPSTCICQACVPTAINLTTGAWGNIPMCGSTGNVALKYSYYCVPTFIYNRASDCAAHAEGVGTCAMGYASHAEGMAAPLQSHTYDSAMCCEVLSVPNPVCASCRGSHAEGGGTCALAVGSHAEGYRTYTDQCGSHVEGYRNIIQSSIGCGSHAEGFCNVLGEGGASNLVAGHVEGMYNVYCCACYSHVEGCCNVLCTGANYTHMEGYGNRATPIAIASHVQGFCNCIDAAFSHAEGCYTYAGGAASHAEGTCTRAGAGASHAEGCGSCACGIASHAEGCCTRADGVASHAEGFCTCAGGDASHAEGYYTYASCIGSHAEGIKTCAYALASHAEGCLSCACKLGQHASASGVIGTETPGKVGSAQYSRFHLMAKTTLSETVELTIGNQGGVITLPPSTTWMYTVKIVASKAGSVSGGAWFIQGVINKYLTLDSVALIAPTVTEYEWNTMGGGSIAIDAAYDGSISWLRIQATGTGAATRWSAIVECAEVIIKA